MIATRNAPFAAAAALVLFSLVSACSDGSSGIPSDTGGGAPAQEDGVPSEASEARGRGSSTPEATLTDVRPYDSTALGALHGEIRLDGQAPERFVIGAEDKAECKHFPDVDHRSEVVVAEDGLLANVYVHLRLASDMDEAAIPAPPAEPAVLDQRGCMYVPHVLALRVGQVLRVENSDPTNHNVDYSAPRNALSGNRNMGPGQAPLEVTFTRPEEKIRFKCDIHPWMGAWVYVEDHPWFAVSGADGRFTISGIPPGTYTLEAIHELYGKERGRVTVAAGRSQGVVLEFQARR